MAGMAPEGSQFDAKHFDSKNAGAAVSNINHSFF
jgi:hypothetical protein